MKNICLFLSKKDLKQKISRVQCKNQVCPFFLLLYSKIFASFKCLVLARLLLLIKILKIAKKVSKIECNFRIFYARKRAGAVFEASKYSERAIRRASLAYSYSLPLSAICRLVYMDDASCAWIYPCLYFFFQSLYIHLTCFNRVIVIFKSD